MQCQVPGSPPSNCLKSFLRQMLQEAGLGMMTLQFSLCSCQVDFLGYP